MGKSVDLHKTNREILQIIELVALEKGIDKELVFQSLEKGLSFAYKKELNIPEVEIDVVVDRDTGKFNTFAKVTVIPDSEEISSQYVQINLTQAKKINGKDTAVGDVIDVEVENVDLSRVSAQIVRGIISQSIYNAEKQQIINDFVMRNSNIVSGKLIRYERAGAVLECGRIEVLIPRTELLGKDQFQIGEIVKGYLDKDNPNTHNGRLVLSRNCDEFVIALFEQNVPEIGNQQTKIVAIAREPGVRTKIAVTALDHRIDAKGSLLGFRNQRIDSVLKHLKGEKIDIILCPFNEDGSIDKVKFVINALSPADGFNIKYFEDSGLFEVSAPDDKIGSILGAGGVNTNLVVILLNKLDTDDKIKYSIEVFSQNDAQAHETQRNNAIMQEFMDKLEIDDDIAKILVVDYEFTSLDEIAYVDAQELLAIPDFDEEIVQILQERAKNSLLLKSLNLRNKMSDLVKEISPIVKLSNIDLEKLLAMNISSLEQIAELDSEELMEMIKVETDKANELIMHARRKCGYFDKE
jgi:N utilization substance protein A